MIALQRLRVVRRLSLLVCFVLAGCGAPPDAPTGSVGAVGGVTGTELATEQVLHIGNGAEPQTLDPHRAEGVPASNILRDLFEGLTIEAPDGAVIPGVAERWERSDDGLVYTFYLRDDARWSNGDPVTAEDFAYGLRRSVDPATLSNYSSILAPITNAMEIIRGEKAPATLGVEAVDAHTFVIRLIEPTPYLPGLLNHATTYPMHRASVEANGAQFARPGKLIGNGAFRLVEWTVQSHIRLERNEHYWDNDNTTLDSVVLYPIENQDAELKRYRADELDITAVVPYKQLDWIRENLGDEVVIAPYLGSYYFGFNVTRPPFKDNPSLRKALSLAIDREIITERITGAGEIPSFNWVPPVQGYERARPEYESMTQAERETEARRLYAEAGYSAEQPLTVELLYNTSENHKRLAVTIASMWRTLLGVQTRPVNEEWKVFLQTRRQKQTTEIFRGGWIGDYNDAFTFAQLMHSANDMNHPGYANPRYDALLAEASAEGDPALRAQMLQAAESVLLDDAPIIPIYFYVSKHLVKPWVLGRESNIMDHHYSKNFRILKH